MKVTKQARAALFVMLFAISILPGCGKKNNDAGVVGVGVVGGVTYPGQLPGTTGYAVSGQVSISQTGAFSGSLASPGGTPVGTAYSRTNGYDQVVLYINGINPQGYGGYGGYANAVAVLSISSGTIQACSGGYGYGYPGYAPPALSIANVQFNYNTVSPTGQLAYSVRVTTTNGCVFNI